MKIQASWYKIQLGFQGANGHGLAQIHSASHVFSLYRLPGAVSEIHGTTTSIGEGLWPTTCVVLAGLVCQTSRVGARRHVPATGKTSFTPVDRPRMTTSTSTSPNAANHQRQLPTLTGAMLQSLCAVSRDEGDLPSHIAQGRLQQEPPPLLSFLDALACPPAHPPAPALHS